MRVFEKAKVDNARVQFEKILAKAEEVFAEGADGFYIELHILNGTGGLSAVEKILQEETNLKISTARSHMHNTDRGQMYRPYIYLR